MLCDTIREQEAAWVRRICRRSAAGRFRDRQRSGQSVCRAATDGGCNLSAARTTAIGLAGRCGRGGIAGQPSTISAPHTTEGLNHYQQVYGWVWHGRLATKRREWSWDVCGSKRPPSV
jgi:hypothetical protein